MEKYEVVKYIENGLELDINVSPSERTIWLSLNEMCLLFERDKSVISRHIRNVFKNGELNPNQTVAKKATTKIEGNKKVKRNIEFYNLDVIISVGYRVKSQNGLLLKTFLDKYLDDYYGNSDNSIIIYNNGEVTLPVTFSPKEDTVWLNKDELILLFDTTRQNIEYHIENIFLQGELEERATCKEFLQVQLEGDRKVSRLNKIYNLDMIISLGYRINTKKGIAFRKWATRVLKEFLLKGYAIDNNRVSVSNDNFIKLENEVERIKKELFQIKEKIENEDIKGKIFFNGEYFDARLFIKNIFSTAKKNIILIDPYSDIRTLDYIKDKKANVSFILCDSDKSKLTNRDINSFIKQYGPFYIQKDNTFHDRFIIIDDKDLYHLGASLNYAGKKTFAITKMEENAFILSIYNKIGLSHGDI